MRINPLRTNTSRAVAVAVAVASAMSGVSWPGAAAAAVAATGTVPSKSYGPDFSLPNRPNRATDPDADTAVTEYDLSLGCIVGGVAGTGLSISAGGLNVINLIAGGIVQATTPVAAYLALGGVVFASFCAVGQAITPTVMAAYRYFAVPQRVPSGSPSVTRYCEAGALPLIPNNRPAHSIAIRQL